MVLPCLNMFTLQFLGVNRAEFVILGVEGQGGQSLTHIHTVGLGHTRYHTPFGNKYQT